MTSTATATAKTVTTHAPTNPYYGFSYSGKVEYKADDKKGEKTGYAFITSIQLRGIGVPFDREKIFMVASAILRAERGTHRLTLHELNGRWVSFSIRPSKHRDHQGEFEAFDVQLRDHQFANS